MAEESYQRRLAADVGRYSRLMERDEAGISALKARRNDVRQPPIAKAPRPDGQDDGRSGAGPARRRPPQVLQVMPWLPRKVKVQQRLRRIQSTSVRQTDEVPRLIPAPNRRRQM